MVFQIIKENGQKKIVPLTADVGAGNPVGSYLYLEKKSNPQGYLYCDGSTFDETAYPLLYAYLGSNVLPDWREFSAVGAEENTTDVYNASTNPTGIIHAHDIFTGGQAKDDQLQDHRHELPSTKGSGIYSGVAVTDGTGGAVANKDTNSVRYARTGTVTRGKRKAVFIYIKATSGLSENAQDNVINTLNEQRSYSTEEHLTGRKWIDGKPTYEKTIDCGALPNNTTKNVAHNIANLDEVIELSGSARRSEGTRLPLPFTSADSLSNNIQVYSNDTNIVIIAGTNRSNYTGYVTLEYTKTTD